MRSVSKLVSACASAAFGIALGAAPPALAQMNAFQVKIHHPTANRAVSNDRNSIEIEGRASTFEKLDLFLVMDTSASLRRTDPNDFRSAGAMGLVEYLFWSNVHIGVVDVGSEAKRVLPLTGDRSAVMNAIRSLDQGGSRNHAAGIRTALKGFEQSARPGSSWVMLVFTDGISQQKAVREAVAEAWDRGVLISTVLLGSSAKSTAIMREIAQTTGGRFVAVSDPAQLPDAFLRLYSAGVERVALRVNDSAPISTELAGGVFSANVPLEVGENRIVARAAIRGGREREHAINVTVRPPGCAELTVRAEHDGEPRLSLASRAVELVVDASRSMWGQMEGRSKIEITKESLDDALDWLPSDLNLSLRAYGHQFAPAASNCEDSQLLAAPATGNRTEIRSAIAALRPKGQTALGYSLARVAADFGDFDGERAVVLVTDGIESCGGDAPKAARALQESGTIPVHVIGFGLASEADQDIASLRAIAEASGGKFVTADSAAELRRALSTTVGTSYRVWHGGLPVAQGTLGSDEPIWLPAGDYRVRLDSVPPHELSVGVACDEDVTVVLRRDGGRVVHSARHRPRRYEPRGRSASDPRLVQLEPVSSRGSQAPREDPPAAAMLDPAAEDAR